MKVVVKKRIVSRKKHQHEVLAKKKKSKVKPLITKSSKSRKPVKNSKSTVKLRNRYIKGQSGNPKGRPKGSKNKWSLSEFQKEFEVDERKHKGSIYKYFFKRARKNDVVLIALLKKWQPDLKSIEQFAIGAEVLPPDKVKNLRKRYRERFE